MNYEEALNYIYGTVKFGSKLGLENIRYLLSTMGDPQDKLQYVHVAGTNGKGSTVSFISEILMDAGYKVGIYTSPYIERFTERIKVNNVEISHEDLVRITGYVKEKVESMTSQGKNHPTEFEIVTAIGFQYFYEQKCDIVVLEVGLGGRLDSTNIIKTPLAAVITTINFDHTARLGNTIEQIAFEKAGIMKPGGDVVLYPQVPEARRVFEEAAAQRGCRLVQVKEDSILLKQSDIDLQRFDFGELKDLAISMPGKHQVKNASTAAAAALLVREKGYAVTEQNIRNGLLHTHWSGRFEVLRKNPWVIIDGAHNPEGAKALRDALETYFKGKRKIFIVGILKDKDYRGFLDVVMPLADKVFTVTPDTSRALPQEELAAIIKNYCNDVTNSDTIEMAVHDSLSSASPEDVICAFGSLYYIGEVRAMLLG